VSVQNYLFCISIPTMHSNFSSCVLQFLLQNESVSLPGIGKFIIQDSIQDFTIKDNILSPPTKKLIFQSFASEDNEFILYIANKLDYSSSQAKLYVKDSILLIINKLEVDGIVNLAGIGKLTLNGIEKSFVPVSKNFHQEYLYLPALNLIPLQKNKVEENVKVVVQEPEKVKVGRVSAIHKEVKPVNTVVDSDLADKQNQMEDPNTNRNSYYYEEDKTFFQEIRGPLFYLLLLGLFIFLVTRFGCSKIGDKAPKVVSDTAEKTSEVFDAAKDSVLDTTTKLISSDGEPYSGKYSDVLTQEMIDEGCVIVVGSFKKSRNAIKMRNKIINKGFQPFDEYHNGFNRVGIIFDCLDQDLVDFIQQVRKDIEPKAWYRIPGYEVAYE